LFAALLVSQAANAFFCFRSGSSNKSFGRPFPYPVVTAPYGNYYLPPIRSWGYAAPRRSATPRPPQQALQWRPDNYRH